MDKNTIGLTIWLIRLEENEFSSGRLVKLLVLCRVLVFTLRRPLRMSAFPQFHCPNMHCLPTDTYNRLMVKICTSNEIRTNVSERLAVTD